MLDKVPSEYFPFDACRPVPFWYVCLVRAARELEVDPWLIEQIAEAGIQSSLGEEEGVEGVDRLAVALQKMGHWKLSSAVLAVADQMAENASAGSMEIDVRSQLLIDLEGWHPFLTGCHLNLFDLQQLKRRVSSAFRSFSLFLQVVGGHPRQAPASWTLLTIPGARIPVPVFGYGDLFARIEEEARGRPSRASWRFILEDELIEWLMPLSHRFAGEFLGEEYQSAFIPFFAETEESPLSYEDVHSPSFINPCLS